MTILNSGVYLITCWPSQRIYIGSAVDIPQRWRTHRSDLNLNKHDNSKLQRAWNKYGSDAFEFSILELTPIAQLIRREQFWIDWYDASRCGFNICPIAKSQLGTKRSPEQRLKMSLWQKGRKMSEAEKEAHRIAALGKPKRGRNAAGINNFRSSSFTFLSPDGIYYSGNNVAEFCRRMNLKPSAMTDLKDGRKLSYQGWTNPNAAQPIIRNLPYCFQSPDGTIHEGRNLTQFAREQGLNFSLLAAVHRGDVTHHKGWTKATPKPLQLRLGLDYS